tara:strand:+ start:34 stop:639 length:606 start_codon:yes stop_codon:yes gene_type:complete
MKKLMLLSLLIVYSIIFSQQYQITTYDDELDTKQVEFYINSDDSNDEKIKTIIYDSDGHIKILEEYKNGINHGNFFHYSHWFHTESNKVMRIRYLYKYEVWDYGNLLEKMIFFEKNGHIYQHYRYDTDGNNLGMTVYKENGQFWGTGIDCVDCEYISYYDNGHIHTVGNKINGKLNGKQTSYNEDGSIKEVKNYKDGKLVK